MPSQVVLGGDLNSLIVMMCCAGMHVFWSKGFQGTSVLNLTASMNMTARSIYLAFGSKEKLSKRPFYCI